VVIAPASRVRDLVAHYPGLDDFLLTYHPSFSKLVSPIRRAIDRRTTLQDAARMAHVEVDKLVADVRAEIDAMSVARDDDAPQALPLN
jgi:hypothetical protein